MPKRTYSELFQTALKKLGGDIPKFINNKTLMQELGWDETRYNRVKEQLKDENIIVAGRGGPGGAVAFANTDEATEPPLMFISYCHADQELKDDLIKHLGPLKR